MEEQQGDRRREGGRRFQRIGFTMRSRQSNRDTLQVGCLGSLFLFNILPLVSLWSLNKSAAVLVSLQSLGLVICIVLIWRHRPHENRTQYFLIAMGFYLLMLGLCVGDV
jgi:O-antigen/teichoic acid export membrane protein